MLTLLQKKDCPRSVPDSVRPLVRKSEPYGSYYSNRISSKRLHAAAVLLNTPLCGFANRFLRFFLPSEPILTLQGLVRQWRFTPTSSLASAEGTSEGSEDATERSEQFLCFNIPSFNETCNMSTKLRKQIVVSPENYDLIKNYGRVNDSFNTAITELLRIAEQAQR